MSELIWIEPRPALRHPILVVAFSGWFDIAEVATGALAKLSRRAGSAPLGSIDPESFYDFTQQRPQARLDGDVRTVVWPANELIALSDAASTHELVLLRGVEPHIRWRTFANLVVEAARTLACELVVTLGAVADAVPHTRAPRVVGSSTTAELASRLGLARPQYEGPTGLIGVLLDALDQAGLPSVSLRVPVPHYAPGTSHPQAVKALLRHLEHVTGTPTGYGALDREVEAQRRRLDAAVAADQQVDAYVTMLEERYDAMLAESVPSGDELAAELERFLRDQEE
jgi:PAC2 family